MRIYLQVSSIPDATRRGNPTCERVGNSPLRGIFRASNARRERRAVIHRRVVGRLQQPSLRSRSRRNARHGIPNESCVDVLFEANDEPASVAYASPVAE